MATMVVLMSVNLFMDARILSCAGREEKPAEVLVSTTMLATIASIAAILTFLGVTWSWAFAKWTATFDDNVFEVIATPDRRVVGQMARTIYWDAPNLSKKLGKSEKRIEKSVKRLKRQGRIVEADGGWRVKDT
jgi:hypothetical protein